MKITNIEDLKNIPEGITELDISGLGLTTLPKLPQGLTILKCGFNQLTSLYNLAMVQRTEGPDAGIKDARVFCNLPQGLTELDCRNNDLTSLDNLPSSLTKLYCDRNELTSLDTLPQGLTVLHCYDNKLTSLDNLPQGLTVLFCNNNKLTSLDIANCDKLKYLIYKNNKFPEEMETILNNYNLTIQEKINKLIEGCLIPYDNSFVLK